MKEVKMLLKDTRKGLVEATQALRVSEARSRKQAEQLRAVSDELSTILNTAGIGITRCSRDLRYVRANETYATIAGVPLAQLIGRPIVEVMGEAAFTTVRPYVERVLAGERVEYESELPFCNRAESLVYRVVYVPDRNPDGFVIGWIACVADITRSKQAERELAERNAQLSLAGKEGLVGTYAYNTDTEIMQISEGYAAIHGYPEGTTEIARSKCLAGVHPEDIGRVTQLNDAFHKGSREYSVEYRIFRSGGEVRWVETRCFISYDSEGRPRRVIGVSIDITERKRAEEQQRALHAELDHRVKNVLATVSAVVSHTRQGSRSVESFAAALEGRIRSMATAHDLLSSDRWRGISLTKLVRCELAAYATGNNIEIGGPEVVLRPEVGQAMAIVLHELVTNAAKYGALSTRNGHVSIRWERRLNSQSRSPLALEWQEIGGPPIVAHGKPSFGTSTIRDLIPYEFGGSVELVLAREGVRCRLELPGDWLANDAEPVPGEVTPTG